MMIIEQKKEKLENEDTTTGRNPDYTSVTYLTDVKVGKCTHLDENRREKEEGKKVTEKKIDTIKVHLQLKLYEAFDRCINSMNSLYSSTTDEDRFIQIVQKSSNTIKDAFVHVGGKLSELPNKRRNTVSREMIQIMK